MKIRIISNPITPFGDFSVGDVLDDTKYPIKFLNHLVDDCNAAERLDYSTKVDEDYEAKKKPLSSQSLPPVKVSRKKIVRKHKKKAR